MPTLHEIAVSLTVKAEQLEAGFKKGADASKRFEADIGALQNRLGQTGAAGAKATATALSLEAAFLRAQNGAKRLEAETAALQKKLGEPGASRSAEATLKLEAAFLRAQAGAKRLEAQTVSLQQQQTTLTSKTTATAAAMSKTATATTASSTAFNPLLGQVKSLVLGYVSLQAVIHGVSAAFAASASVERQERAWKGIAGSVAGGRQEIEFVRTSADKLGVSFTSLEEGYRRIASSAKGTTLEGQVSKQIFTDIAVTMQALGASSADVAGAMRALGQMISTGVVQADELKNELGNRLPNVMGIAAKSTNMLTDDFRKLQEKGGILTTDFLPNFAKTMRNTYVPATEAGAKVTLSLEQEAERAKNVLQQMAAIGLKETGIENWLKRLLAGMTEFGKEVVKSSDRINAMRAIDAERTKGTIETAAGGAPLSATATAAAAQELQRIEKQSETTFAAMMELMRRQEQAIKAGLPFPEALTRALEQAKKAWLSAQAKREAFLTTVPTLPRKDAVPMPGEGPSFAAEQRALQGKTTRFDAEALAIHKDVEAAGLALIRLGKTAREAAEEQLKLLDKETEKLREKYKDQVFGSATTGAGVGKRAPAEYQMYAAQAGQKWNVDPYLIQAIMAKETENFDRFAVSPAGAQGLMQIMPTTAAALGLKDPFDPKQSIDAAAQLLNELGKTFKDKLPLVIAAYNAGAPEVLKAGGIPNFKETKAYVPAVTATYAALRAGDPGSMGGGGSLLATQRETLMKQIAGSKADEATIKALADAEVEANTTITESMAAMLEKLETGTDDQNAYARSVYASQAASAAAAGDTVTLERNLAALGTELDKSTVSTTAQERALILERLATVQGYEATKLLAQIRIEDANLIEQQTKAHKDLTAELKAQQVMEEMVLRAHEGSADAMLDIIEQMKAGFPTIEEYEKAMRKLQGLGAKPGSGTFALAENLKTQSTAAFKAIKQGAEDLANFLQSHLLSQMTPFTGGEAEDFTSRISVADERVSRLESRRDRLSEQLFERPEDKGLLEQLRRTDEALVGAKEHLKDFERASIEAAERSASPWRKFGDTIVQEFAKIVMEGTKFREEMSKLLMEAGAGLLKLIGRIVGGAAGGSSGDIDFNAGGGGGSSGDIDFAKGGPVGAGELARVGEAGRELMLSEGRMRLVGLHGPEVVRSREPAFVIPHQQTMTLLRGQRPLDNVVHTMAKRQFGGGLNAGQDALVGEAGFEGVVRRGGNRSHGGVNITVNVQGVKDMQSFVQPRSQAEIQRALAATFRAAQRSL